MRLYELVVVKEAADGPAQGSTIIKTMDAGTFRTLADLNAWEREKKELKRKLANDKSNEASRLRRAKNSLIFVGSKGLEVSDVEHWIETGDNEFALNIARKANWGISRAGKAFWNEITQDPEWAAVALDVWKDAARQYLGQERDLTKDTVGDRDARSLTSPLGIERRFDMIARKYRLKYHVDKVGRRLSPHMPHPEAHLPTKWGQLGQLGHLSSSGSGS